jgi:hypothetical protein
MRGYRKDWSMRVYRKDWSALRFYRDLTDLPGFNSRRLVFDTCDEPITQAARVFVSR